MILNVYLLQVKIYLYQMTCKWIQSASYFLDFHSVWGKILFVHMWGYHHEGYILTRTYISIFLKLTICYLHLDM